MIDDIIGQSFQRIQRNRQSRIRVKMCRKAGKRADEVVIDVIFILVFIVMVKVLEEEMTTTEEDIDIVGVEKKEAAEEERRMKAAMAKVVSRWGLSYWQSGDPRRYYVSYANIFKIDVIYIIFDFEDVIRYFGQNETLFLSN